MNDGSFGVNADKFEPQTLADEESTLLNAALGPVLRDIRVTGAIMPEILEEAHEDLEGVISAWVANHVSAGGMGIRVPTYLPLTKQVAGLAEQLQEWEMEELAAVASPAVWPQCPDHPASHPLSPEVRDGQATWTCPRTGRRIAAIGELEPGPQP
jgi:hypothetical protein